MTRFGKMMCGVTCSLLLVAPVSSYADDKASPPPQVADSLGNVKNPQMQAVLDSLASLNPKPIEPVSPDEARKQPSASDAVMALLKKQGKSTDPEPVGSVKNETYSGPGGQLPVRIYMPKMKAFAK